MRTNPLTRIKRWALYSTEDNLSGASDLQLVVLDPDHHPPFSSSPAGCIRLAALSVGEAQDHRPYWPRVSTAAYLVEQAKDSEGNVRVDFRDPEWQRILLNEEIPRALAHGFQGLMLDALDSIPYLEEKDPEKFAGLREALKNWLAELRKTYPDIILLANGSEALEIAAPYVDGYVSQGVFTAWDPASRRARRTTQEERDSRLDQLGNALAIAPLPVYTIEDADSKQRDLSGWASTESVKRGFRPFIKIR